MFQPIIDESGHIGRLDKIEIRAPPLNIFTLKFLAGIVNESEVLAYSLEFEENYDIKKKYLPMVESKCELERFENEIRKAGADLLTERIARIMKIHSDEWLEHQKIINVSHVIIWACSGLGTYRYSMFTVYLV